MWVCHNHLLFGAYQKLPKRVLQPCPSHTGYSHRPRTRVNSTPWINLMPRGKNQYWWRRPQTSQSSLLYSLGIGRPGPNRWRGVDERPQWHGHPNNFYSHPPYASNRHGPVNNPSFSLTAPPSLDWPICHNQSRLRGRVLP